MAEEVKEKKQRRSFQAPAVGAIANEVASILARRLPYLLPRRKKKKKQKKLDNPVFLDTSAIIDGRIFDVVGLGLLWGVFVVPESILSELKRIADSQDVVKRERGRKGLDKLEKLKKMRGVKLVVMSEDSALQFANGKRVEVDDQLIQIAKKNKGRVITCDYNLEKKASIQGVVAVNVNALANCLKVSAVPGEALHVSVLHKGKDPTQGVGYLDDGTMIVVESGFLDLGRTIDVVVSRVIQTTAGRILFAKKI